MLPERDEQVRRTRATYDRIGRDYQVANAEIPDSVRDSMDRFQAALPLRARVADVGCGPGRDLRELQRRGLVCVGFDLSFGMLQAATTTSSSDSGQAPSPFTVADMGALPVRAASLQGIWCAASLLHVPRDRTGSTLREFARVLASHGIVHLSIAEGSDEGMRPARYGDGGPLWFVERTESEIGAALDAAGFEVHSIARSVSHRRWLTLLCSKGSHNG